MKKNNCHLMITSYLLMALLLWACNVSDNGNKGANNKESTLNQVNTSIGNLYFETFKGDSVTENSTLVFVLHGDAPFQKPDYQYHFARLLTKQNPDLIAVGMLRPGYTDPYNNTSDGEKGLTVGDNYTVENTAALAETIEKLKDKYQPAQTLLVGHSGGAALSANLISLHPKIAESAILVGCPCDLDAWRSHMDKRQPGFDAWKGPVDSPSAIDLVEEIDASTIIKVVIGEQDDVAPIDISRAYYQRLIEADKKAELFEIPRAGHEILFNEKVLGLIKELK